MRILHTSDWHLGQNFYSKSRAAEHEAFLNWLLETAQAHEVDAIIVAGDIFDTGSPPSYARELHNRFVVNLQQTGCHLVIVAGNHDSVATLNESRDILAFLNTTVVASAGHAPQILKNATARRAQCCAQFRFYARAISCKARQVCPAAKNSSICCRPSPAIITSNIRKPAPCAAIRPFRSLPPGTSPPSEPVRVMRCARSISVRWTRFRRKTSPADYIALGHIHRAQIIGGCEHIRYCGSPISLSFDETGKAKSVHLVSFTGGKLSAVETLEVPVTQPLAVLKGDLAAITAQLEQWRGAALNPPSGSISKSPPTTTCTICSVKYRR